MSEKFEQKVKDKLDELRFEPNEAVWQKVRLAIRPERKKRRFIFWWFLPFIIAGGVWVLFPGDQDDQQIPADQPTARGNQQVITHPDQQPESTSQSDLPGTPAINRPELAMNTADLPAESIRLKSATKTKNISVANPSNTRQSTRGGHTTRIEQTTAAADIRPQDEDLQETVTVVDADSAQTVEAAIPQLAVEKTASTTAEDSAATSTGINAPVRKKKKWSLGITADIGGATLVNGLSNLSEKSARMEFTSSPVNSGSGSGNAVEYRNYRVSGGMLGGIGLTAERSLLQKLDFRSTLMYRRYALQVHSTDYKDTIIGGNITTIVTDQSSSRYRLNSFSLHTGVAYRFINRRNFTLRVQTGLDQHFVFGSVRNDQLPTLGQAPLQGNTRVQNIVRNWQPMWQLGVSADTYLKNGQRLQFAPYFNYGLRQLQQQGGNRPNHLVHFGIAATYFFR